MDTNTASASASASELEKEERVFSVIEQNTKIEVALDILNLVRWDVIEQVIENTPPELKSQLNYKIIVKTLEFQNSLNELVKAEIEESE